MIKVWVTVAVWRGVLEGVKFALSEDEAKLKQAAFDKDAVVTTYCATIDNYRAISNVQENVL